METITSTGGDARLSDNATTRAIAWLTAWDSQHLHRTATAGDEAGADWLLREAAGLGVTTVVEKFALDRLDPIDAYLNSTVRASRDRFSMLALLMGMVLRAYSARSAVGLRLHRRRSH